MYQYNVSGQNYGFCLISVLSGFPVPGFSGLISGRKIVDGGDMALISGYIVEKSGGAYQAKLFDFDVNGANTQLFITASGCVPIFANLLTDLNISGRVFPQSGRTFPASGANTVVPPSTLSGVNTNANVVRFQTVTAQMNYAGSLPIVSVREWSDNLVETDFSVRVDAGGTDLLNVHMDPAVISGVAVASGLVYPASGMTFPASGAFVVAGIASGSSVIATIYSGQLSGQQVNLTSGQSYPASGVNVTVPIASISGAVANSGLFVSVPIATISGTVPNVLSGLVHPASGATFPASGAFVNVPIASVSGVNAVTASGLTYIASGTTVNVYSGQLSGQQVTLTSGQSYTASGIFSVASVASGSSVIASLYSGQQVGVWSGTAVNVFSGTLFPASGATQIASGPFVTATATVNSGLSVIATIYSGQLSGQMVNILSGNAITILSGSVTASILSGTTFLASGHSTFWSGFLNPASGMTFPASGAFVVAGIASGASVIASLYSGQQVAVVSGTAVNVFSGTLIPLSGFTYPASGTGGGAASGLFVTVPINTISGVNAVVPPATLSGVIANSGIFASVPIASISGINVVASVASGSSVIASLYSGQQVAVVSGTSVNVFSGTLIPLSGWTWPASGTGGSPQSGQVWLASGNVTVAGSVLDKSGYGLHGSGIDSILVESGLNARQALAIDAAGLAGRLAGAGTSLIEIQAAGVSGIIRISGSFDASGNRVTSFLNPPV